MRYLFILTKKWGKDFTGATLATQYFTERWKNLFTKIYVFTLESGFGVNSTYVKVEKFKNEKALYYELINKKELLGNNVIGYSDDHLGCLLKKGKIPYIHTYHGNWPDAKWINLEFFLKSFYFIPMYKKTLHGAVVVVNVSKYMENFTKKYNKKSVVIRNGMDFKPVQVKERFGKRYLMVGNIDSRKYKKAVLLSNILICLDSEIIIDIYGKEIDRKIFESLKKCPNIQVKGQCNEIPYAAYLGLINTSTIENLSISVCEAIKSEIPVFCFNVGGLSEVVQNGVTGFIFKNGDVKHMAETLVNYVQMGEQMSVDSAVLESFDWDVSALRYIELFNQIGKDKEE